MTQRDLRKPTLLLAGTALTALVALAAPAAADHDRPGVTVYHDVHFSGRQQTFYDDVPRLDGSYVGNDTISSLEVDRGCRVTLYSDAYYRGTATTFTYSVDDLRASPIGNDRASSLRVDCGRPGYGDDRPGDYDWDDERGDSRVVLYSDTGFRGRREAFDDDDRDLRNNRIGNDRVSSIRIRRGCRVILYSDTRFRGRATELVDDVEDLRQTSVGNDRVSSIKVDCRRGGYGDRGEGYGGRDDRGDGYGQGDRRGRGVTLYEHADYRGRSETFYGDDARLGNNFIRQDGASSARVDPGCVATLYEHDGFRGRATTLSHDDPNLRNNRVGNDRVSSIRVDCRGGRDPRD